MKTTSSQNQPNRGPGSMKSEGQKTRIVAKKIAGKSDRQIAREEGINRETVGRILKASHFQQVMRAFREEMLQLIPESISHYRTVLERANDPESAAARMFFRKDEKLTGPRANQAMQRAYERGFKAGLDATKVASDVLHGTQVFVSKSEQGHTIYDEATEQFTDEQLRARIIEQLTQLAENSRPTNA